MTLLSLKQALLQELQSDVSFRFVNTRLILRTGVDLLRTDGAALSDARLAQVKHELRAMGCLKDHHE